MRYDDSDMKIVGSGGITIGADGSSEDDRRTESEYERQLGNGNLARARRLGATLADSAERLESDGPAVTDAISAHKKMMMLFALVIGIEEELDDQLLRRAALNVFYDTLKKEKPLLYDSMSSSGAFTFYYLDYRKGGDRTARLSKSFAMLCGREDDEELAKCGGGIFNEYRDYAKRAIGEMSFVK